MEETTAAEGEWGKVLWAVDANGQMPARKIYDGLPEKDRAKMKALFNRLVTFGRIHNPEQFHDVKNSGEKLFEFKDFQRRFLGAFRGKGVFVVAHAITAKQRMKLREQDIERTHRILKEHDQRTRSSK